MLERTTISDHLTDDFHLIKTEEIYVRGDDKSTRRFDPLSFRVTGPPQTLNLVLISSTSSYIGVEPNRTGKDGGS